MIISMDVYWAVPTFLFESDQELDCNIKLLSKGDFDKRQYEYYSCKRTVVFITEADL